VALDAVGQVPREDPGTVLDLTDQDFQKIFNVTGRILKLESNVLLVPQLFALTQSS
jgi:hypothetical protein